MKQPNDEPSGLPFSYLIRQYAFPRLRSIIGLSLVTVLANLITVAQPAILAGLLVLISGRRPGPPATADTWLDLNSLGNRMLAWVGSQGIADTNATLLALCGAFVLLSVLAAAANYAADYGSGALRLQMSRQIRLDLLRKIFEQDLSFFLGSSSGELASRVTRDATNTAQGLAPLVRGVLHHGIQLSIYGAYLVSTSIWLTVTAGVVMLVQLLVTQLLKKPMRRVVQLEMDASATMNGALHEAFTNVRVTKSFGAEAYQLRVLSDAVEFVEQSLMKRNAIEKLEPHGRSIVDAIAVMAILLIAIVELRKGALTFEGLVLFIYIGRAMFAPMSGLATSVLWVHSISSAFKRVGQLLGASGAIVDGPVARSRFDSVLEVRNVTFFHGAQRVLDDVSFSVQKGQVVALVGHSGAGKSTVADLLLRLYDPDSGAVLIDGHDVRTLRLREYRQMFGVVSQETLLLRQTIRENIRYGREDLTDVDVLRAARLADVDAFVSRLSIGYDTVVGERGVTLSGGERQRVAIARALAHSPQILLLDEATSALDSVAERDVQAALEGVLNGVTAVVIAHRLSTVRRADQIVVLSGGRVEAVGRHESLLASSRTYANLYRLQFEPAVRT